MICEEGTEQQMKASIDTLGWLDAHVAARAVVNDFNRHNIFCSRIGTPMPLVRPPNSDLAKQSHVPLLLNYPAELRDEFRRLAEKVCKGQGVIAGKLVEEDGELKLTVIVPLADYSLSECEKCGSKVGVLVEDSRTAYTNAEKNRNLCLCHDCAEEHHTYWDGQWAEYNEGRR